MMPMSLPPAAAIFDMDGVLVNSNPFHVQKWIDLLRQRNVPFDPAAVPSQILGKHNDDAFRAYFGSSMTQEQMRQLGAELEAQFRIKFRPYARPLPGLMSLLGELRAAGIPMAVASSAVRPNVEFVVDVLGIRSFFRLLITGEDVEAHKPDPEIYVEAAVRLGAAACDCVAFEDSFPGIEAVRNAGMKCVAIASTFPLEELSLKTRANLVTASFENLSLVRLRSLFAAAVPGAGNPE